MFIQKHDAKWTFHSAIGSIKYAMLCTRPIVYLSLSLTKEYKINLIVEHWTVVKNILSED